VKKNTDLTQVTDKLYHIIWYQVHLAMNRVQSQNISDIVESSIKHHKPKQTKPYNILFANVSDIKISVYTRL
jgi:hypothetical protein